MQLESGIYHEQLLPRGFVPPEDQEPNLGPLDFYVDAFRELSSCRPGGMGLLPIPFTAIVEYSRIYALGDEEEFAWVIRQMDNTFMRLYAADQKRGTRTDATSNANTKDHDKR